MRMSAVAGRRHRGDRGSVTLGLAVVFPIVLLMIVMVIQTALVWHARNVAVAAADQGVEAGRLDGGSPADARAQALDMLAHSTGDLISNVRVTVVSTATQLSVHVHGTVVGVLPGLHLPVDADVVAPRERFVPEQSPS
jgi:Flp pilus assembly protein TadG